MDFKSLEVIFLGFYKSWGKDGEVVLKWEGLGKDSVMRGVVVDRVSRFLEGRVGLGFRFRVRILVLFRLVIMISSLSFSDSRERVSRYKVGGM